MVLLSPEFAARLERLVIAARRRARSGQGGRNLSTRQGRSPEFSDHRAYSEGDDPRFLDWNLFFRLGKPYLKLFLKEEDLHVQLILDSSASMAGKFEYARRLAAALGYVVLCGGDRVELVASTTANRRTLLHGKRDIPRFFQMLQAVAPDGGMTPLELAKSASCKTLRGWGLRIMISDFFGPDEPKTLIAPLTRGRHEAYALQVLSPFDVAPQLTGRVLLRDAESGQTLRCQAEDVLPEYIRGGKALCDHLRETCRTYHCGYEFLTSEQPLEAAVTISLQRCGLLR